MEIPFISNLSNVDAIILIGAAIVFLVMAYMVFKQVMKAVLIGTISAAIPIILYLVGFEIELSLQTILWFGLAGIATYFVYDVISGWITIIRIFTWPFRWIFRRKKGSQKKGEKQKEEKKS
ncbi:MAG: hypothetical protein QXN71_01805 [Candidatus Aenigmatarchaeota archaeon]